MLLSRMSQSTLGCKSVKSVKGTVDLLNVRGKLPGSAFHRIATLDSCLMHSFTVSLGVSISLVVGSSRFKDAQKGLGPSIRAGGCHAVADPFTSTPKSSKSDAK